MAAGFRLRCQLTQLSYGCQPVTAQADTEERFSVVVIVVVAVIVTLRWEISFSFLLINSIV